MQHHDLLLHHFTGSSCTFPILSIYSQIGQGLISVDLSFNNGSQRGSLIGAGVICRILKQLADCPCPVNANNPPLLQTLANSTGRRIELLSFYALLYTSLSLVNFALFSNPTYDLYNITTRQSWRQQCRQLLGHTQLTWRATLQVFRTRSE